MRLEAAELQLEGLNHGFFTRQGGVSGGIYDSLNIGLGSDDDRDSVLENRRRVAAEMNVDTANLLAPYQIHSPDVIAVTTPWQDGMDRRADALVTSTPGLAIGISTADCGPILFADPKARVVGAAHSGWKGAVTGVLQNTVSAMVDLGASPSGITAVLGPAISQSAYEVGPEFQQRFLEANPANEIYFLPSEKAGHFMFDLPAYIGDTLHGLGLAKVANMGLCTYADEDRFYSYRRTTHRGEPDYGRQISAIVLTR
ncbi:Laccase domain protein YfiH [Labrenzia sp. THAF82]|uniref:peptidoglycan editing factor PgeF n=1 Tax=Labrenzia sp. THAF82 TaxID=2587861 RepID=UPI001269091D|nr:peptidoglycan editing factor PgeF [Labrenzia sp. THAF82]QFT30789.1 Laccase domain protein YfiH [Labrenzia sp. THAF82]